MRTTDGKARRKSRSWGRRTGLAVLVMLAAWMTACSGNGNNDAASDSGTASEAASQEALPAGDRAVYAEPMPAYPDMEFKDYGTNPFVDAREDAQSTFALDVDTGSYTVARNYVSRGTLPPPEAVRVEELLNYFPSDVQPPTDATFRIYAESGPSPFREQLQLVRITVKGKELPQEDRAPLRLTLVVDVSGSMERENRLGLVQRSLALLVDQLREDDAVGIVTYGTEARTVLEMTPVEEKDRILEEIDRLRAGGSTNAEAGLKEGYKLANREFDSGATNRVVLLSDGVANVGETGPEAILKEIEEYAGEGIKLTSIGVGMGNYNDVMMEQLADQGDGIYAYMDSFSEARRLFVDQLAGTLQPIASDAKIQVEFDPEQVVSYRLLGYENRDIADEDFRNDDVDAGEIGSGHTVTALYEVELREGIQPEAGIGTVTLRYRDEATGDVGEQTAALQAASETSKRLRFLAAVSEFGEILRKSPWAEDSSLEQVLAVAEASAQNEEELGFVGMLKDAMAVPTETESE